MVSLLVFDVRNNGSKIGFAYGKDAVAILPREGAKGGKCLVDPFRGITLQKLCYLGRAVSGRRHHKSVNVVGRASNLESCHFMFARDASDVAPYSFLDVGIEIIDPGFRAVYDVIEE